jgi:hypothetical protein
METMEHTGRKNGASILSILTMSPSCRAFHQTHKRRPLETANGVNQVASSAARKMNRTPTKNFVLHGTTLL